MSIATDLTRLQTAKADLKTAIEGKGVTVPSATKIDGYADLVDSIPSGGGGEDRNDLTMAKDVDFVDFDGRLLYSYTASEFANLSALPANPTYPGLIAQGWNWTLADAQEYVAEHGALVVGQNYVTDDGKTRLYMNISSIVMEYAPDVNIRLWNVSSPTGTIDWGDGTTTSLPTGTGEMVVPFHKYQSRGEYVITIDVTSGSIRLGRQGANGGFIDSDPYKECLQKVEIGNGLVGLCRSCFSNMFSMKSVSIPTTCIDHDTGSDYPLFSGAQLKCIVLPNGTPGRRPNMSAVVGGSDRNQNLRYVSVPKTMNGIRIDNGMYRSLRKLTIPDYPFDSALAIQLYDASSLTHLAIPGTYTTISVDRVRSSLLRKLVIPGSVTSIGESAFAYNRLLEEVHFLPTTPPTIGTFAFRDLPSTCVIYVPYSDDHSILAAYQATTNLSAFAAQMQEEPQ